MRLADTSVWVDHLRAGDPAMERALLAETVLGHSLVTGEIAMAAFATARAFCGACGGCRRRCERRMRRRPA